MARVSHGNTLRKEGDGHSRTYVWSRVGDEHVLQLLNRKMSRHVPTCVGSRKSMWVMAHHNDMEGIACLLDQGVNPGAREERDGVRVIMDRCVGWIGGRVVSLRRG
jgi:hypothetical protein